MRQLISWLAVFLFPVVVIGAVFAISRDPGVPNLEWPTQMARSPAYLSQTANPVLPLGMTQQPPVAGTIPRGFTPFHYGATPAEAARAGRELKNPYQATPEALARGEQLYRNYCMVCHGPGGNGDGPIIPKYPNPPGFRTPPSKALTDGEMFHVITLGRNNMPAHAPLVSADDRWKAILYIRKLQAQ